MMSRRKKSSSCDNLTALSLYYADHDQAFSYCKDQMDFKQRKKSLTLPRFSTQRLKSSLVRSGSMDRARMNSGGLVENIDITLSDIRQKLAMFREQDIKFRKRMNSLSSSIEDLTPSSGQSSPTPSEPVELVRDVITPSDDATEEQQCKDDKSIENEIKNLSESFSSEVFNRLPSIAVMCHRSMYASDPSLHETVKLLT